MASSGKRLLGPRRHYMEALGCEPSETAESGVLSHRPPTHCLCNCRAWLSQAQRLLGDPCSPGTWLSSTPVLQPGLWDSLPGEGLVSGEQALWTEQTRVLKRNSSFYKSPLWGTQTLNLMFVKHPRTKIQILS